MIADLTDPATTVAVVGATDEPGKYGGRIYRNLKGKGFTVYAVNPSRDTVDGDPCYPDLASLPAPPTIVDVVVPPPVTLRVLDECAELGLKKVWVQPGAENDEVMARLEDDGFEYMAGGPCIMVETQSLAG